MGRWEKVPVGLIDTAETDLVHDRCYLSPVGNCSAKMTKEHFISRNILEQIFRTTMKFENASHFFGGKSTIEISIDSFAAKVLCDKHNSALSELDAATGLAFSAIESLAGAAVRIFAGGETNKIFYIASGLDMERWLVKVYCGLVAAGKIRGKSGRILRRDALDIHLLHSLIGTVSLLPPLGLYVHNYIGQTKTSGRISFSTVQLTDGSDEVGGLMLSLGIMDLVLITSPRFGEKFTEKTWYRHQTLTWNLKHAKSKLAFLFTY